MVLHCELLCCAGAMEEAFAMVPLGQTDTWTAAELLLSFIECCFILLVNRIGLSFIFILHEMPQVAAVAPRSIAVAPASSSGSHRGAQRNHKKPINHFSTSVVF